MAITDYLAVENPGVVAIAIGLLVFIISFTILDKRIRNRASAIIASLAIAAIVAWRLYKVSFKNGTVLIAAIFIIVGLVIIWKIFMSFYRWAKYSLR